MLEAQYQDAVRIEIDNLYTAFVNVLAARETVRYARASVAGLERVVADYTTLYRRASATRADVGRVRSLYEAALVGEAQAGASLARAKQVLAGLLNVPPEGAEGLELRGTVAVTSRPELTAAWRVEPNMSARVDLGNSALAIAGVRINVPNEVKPYLDRSVGDAVAALQDRMRNEAELLVHARWYFGQAAQGADQRKMKLLAELGLEYLRLAGEGAR